MGSKINRLGENRGITPRSVLVGLILIPLNYFWVVQLELIRYSLVSYLVPYYTVIFILSILILLNSFLGRFSPRSGFTYAELAVIYVILSVTGGFCSHNFMGVLVSTMGHAFWFATLENDWAALFWDHIPRWLTVQDRDVLKGFYAGNSTLYSVRHVGHWIFPALIWTGFLFVLVISMICINALVRKQWSDREKLTYPIIQLPVQMMNPGSGFFRARAMWIGFSVAAGISILSGLHYLYPVIPHIQVTRTWIARYFTVKPWNIVMSGDVIAFYPFAIGIGFVMPMDLAFSVWFFHLFHKIVAAVGISAGAPHSFPYLNYQTMGSYIGLTFIAVWIGRGHLIGIFRNLFSRNDMDDADEPMSYRASFLLFILAFISLVIFSVMAGMSAWIAVIFFAAYYIFSITVTRIHAELGYPVHDMAHSSPQNLLVTSIGTSSLGASSLTTMALFRWFNRTYASHPMPHQLDGFQIADAAGASKRRLTIIMLAATVIGSLSAFWILLDAYYRFGGESGRMGDWAIGFGRENFTYLQNWIYYRSGPNYSGIMSMTVGLLIVIILSILKMRLFWWPLHPLGYPVSVSWGGTMLWSCMLISSAAKWVVFRMGGWRMYRKLVPFFLGLILGDFTLGSIWTLIGIALGIRTYDFWP